MAERFFWVRPKVEDNWEPAKDDGDGWFQITGVSMPGKPAVIGPEIMPPVDDL